MMMIFNRNYNGLQFILFLMCLIEASKKWFSSTAAMAAAASSSSDMLIIRHGRSRVRHSTEKNHIRWGLQAFDNLTLYDYDYESANGTNASNETIFDMNFGNGTNQTLPFGSEPFGYFSFESFINSNNNNSSSNNNNNNNNDNNNHNGEMKLASTSAPTSSVNRWSASTSSTPKKKLAKKQIMESIRKNVEEGLEYLRTHAHLSQPTAMMPSEKSLRQIQQQQQQQQRLGHGLRSSGDDQVIHTLNNKQNNKLSFEEIRSSSPSLFPFPSSTSKLFKLPSSSYGQAKLAPSEFQQRKMQNDELKHQYQQYQQQQQQQQQHKASMKHEGNAQIAKSVGALFDFEMQSDDANKESTHMHEDVIHQQHKFNQQRMHNMPSVDNNVGSDTGIGIGDTTAKTIGTASSSVPSTETKASFDHATKDDLHNLNGFGANHLKSNTKTLHRLPLTNNELKHVLQQKIKHKDESPHATSLHAVPKRNDTDTDTLPKIKSNRNVNNQFEMANGLSSASAPSLSSSSSSASSFSTFDELNDEQQLNDENIDDTNPFQFDANYEQNINFDIKDENSNEFQPIFRMEDIDLDDLDETSRNNRLNLMKGRDVVTNFLQIVESQHLLGANCTAGTALNLGEGVVDRYAQDRFRVEAEVAVNRANMLTRIFKLSSTPVQTSEHILHASVLSMVEFDDDIYAAGHCFDWNQHMAKRGLFCPFAHRLPPPDQGATLVKDLASEYPYLGNTSEWFFQARKNAEKVIAKNEQYIKAFHLYSTSVDREMDEILSVRYEDGRWSKPYYDCGGGNIWMLTYTVPFFGYENGTYFFKGTSGIDIDLRRVDIDQCPQRQVPGGLALPLNIFAGTDKCKQRTTMCEAISGLGFRRGSYKCVCRKGFYFPDTTLLQKYFNGSQLEEEYEKLMLGELSLYNNANTFECLPCAEGCDSCKDASPCVAALNWPMRTSILVLACAVIGFLPPAAWFTFRYQQVKVLRAASPALLRVIALGAFFIYCTSIVMYPPPSIYTCTARVWLREIGFSLTYGALMLKTWRISVVFRVRSAKAVKITDATLLKRLGIICLCVGIGLLVRTIVAPPVVIVGRTADDLKAYLCKADWWDHTFTSMEVLFLAWGVRLCIMVRKAPSEFNESRFISMAIYNEFFLTCFLNVSMLFLQSPANPDLLYIIFFCHTQLTVTLLLVLIFGSKVYLVFRSGGKPPEDSTGVGAKSSGAKFICRSQARPLTNPYPSTATSSTTQHGTHIEHRLTEQEATEEIRMLMQNFMIQLQSVRERIPSRGSAMATIGVLLENCKPLSSAPATLMPPALPAPSSKKSGYNLNNTASAVTATTATGTTAAAVTATAVADKSTNTNNGEMLYCRQDSHKRSPNQANGTAGTACCSTITHISITDASCDKHGELQMDLCQKQEISSCELPDAIRRKGNLISEAHNQDETCTHGSACGEQYLEKQSSAVAAQHKQNNGGNSARELNFLNLKLRCMCSGDDGSGSGNNSASKHHASADDKNDSDNDDKTEIEISDIEAITEIGDSVLGLNRHSQKMHCESGHCCYFMHCCYCLENGLVRSEALCDTALRECSNHQANSNSLSKISYLSSNCTISANQNLACKRCDEICKSIIKQRNHKHEIGLCSATEASDDSECNCSLKMPLANKQCCDDDGGDNGAPPLATSCHCQWRCIENADLDKAVDKSATNNTNQKDNSGVRASEQFEGGPSGSSGASNIDDENRIRCSRCAKELFVSAIDNRGCGNKSKSENDSNLIAIPSCKEDTADKLSLCSASGATTSAECPKSGEAQTEIADDENIGDPGAQSAEANAANANKRAKPSDKLVLDLNDRSKYTKEVSV